MSERQKRTDIGTANVVTRGVNILAVRDRSLAQNYMEFNHVPAGVIGRVLDHPASRRAPSAEQVISEAITPSLTRRVDAKLDEPAVHDELACRAPGFDG